MKLFITIICLLFIITGCMQPVQSGKVYPDYPCEIIKSVVPVNNHLTYIYTDRYLIEIDGYYDKVDNAVLWYRYDKVYQIRILYMNCVESYYKCISIEEKQYK